MKKKNSLGIPDSTIDMLAREILNFTRNYLATEEGRKDFEEWKRKRDAKNAAETKNNPKHKKEGVTNCHAFFLFLQSCMDFSRQNKAKSERSIVK